MIKILEMIAGAYKDQLECFKCWYNIILLFDLALRKFTRVSNRAITWGNEGPEMRGNGWTWALKIWGHSEDLKLIIQYAISVTKLKQKGICVILDCGFDLFWGKKKWQDFEPLNFFSALELS